MRRRKIISKCAKADLSVVRGGTQIAVLFFRNQARLGHSTRLPPFSPLVILVCKEPILAALDVSRMSSAILMDCTQVVEAPNSFYKRQ